MIVKLFLLHYTRKHRRKASGNKASLHFEVFSVVLVPLEGVDPEALKLPRDRGECSRAPGNIDRTTGAAGGAAGGAILYGIYQGMKRRRKDTDNGEKKPEEDKETSGSAWFRIARSAYYRPIMQTELSCSGPSRLGGRGERRQL